MPYCKAYRCKNCSGRVKGKSFFMIPRPVNEIEKRRGLQWLHNIGRSDIDIRTFKFGKDSVVCEDHFHPSCIRKDVIDPSLLNKRKKKELVPGAIPTIFVHKTYDQINIDGTTILQRSSSLSRTNTTAHSEVSIM